MFWLLVGLVVVVVLALAWRHDRRHRSSGAPRPNPGGDAGVAQASWSAHNRENNLPGGGSVP